LERRAVGGGELVLDVAHNPAAVAAIVDELRTWPSRPTVVLFACSPDKDRAAMSALLRTLGELWTLSDAEEDLVAAEAAARRFCGLHDPNLAVAIEHHLAIGGRVVVCGSHRLVGGLESTDIDPSDPR
jgi:folylpolyglutamate synthase/dihydropteroate synthase